MKYIFYSHAIKSTKNISTLLLEPYPILLWIMPISFRKIKMLNIILQKKCNFVQKPRNKSSLGGFTGQKKTHQCCNWNEKTGICSGFLFLSLIAKRCWNIDPSFICARMPWQMQVWTRVSRHMPGMQMLCTMRNTGCGYVQMRLTRVNIWSIYHPSSP